MNKNKLFIKLSESIATIEDARRILGSIGEEGILLTAMRVKEERDRAIFNAEMWERIALREAERIGEIMFNKKII